MVIHTQKSLNWQADRIESILARHRISGKVAGGTANILGVQFRLQAKVGTKISSIARMAGGIATAIGANSVRVYRRGSGIVIDARYSSHQIELPESMARGGCIDALYFFAAHPEASVHRAAERLGVPVEDANQAWEYIQKHQTIEG